MSRVPASQGPCCLAPPTSRVPASQGTLLPGGPAGARPLPKLGGSGSHSDCSALGPGASHLKRDEGGEPSTGLRKSSVFQSLKKPLPAFEERHVKDGGVGIHELQQESLEDQPLLEALLRLWNL